MNYHWAISLLWEFLFERGGHRERAMLSDWPSKQSTLETHCRQWGSQAGDSRNESMKGVPGKHWPCPDLQGHGHILAEVASTIWRPRNCRQEGRALAAAGRKRTPGRLHWSLYHPLGVLASLRLLGTLGQIAFRKAKHLLIQCDQWAGSSCMQHMLSVSWKIPDRHNKESPKIFSLDKWRLLIYLSNLRYEILLVGLRGTPRDIFWIAFTLKILQENLPTLRVTWLPSD